MTSASCESPYKTVIAEKINVLLLMSSRDRTTATVMLGHAYTLGCLRAWIERIGLVNETLMRQDYNAWRTNSPNLVLDCEDLGGRSREMCGQSTGHSGRNEMPKATRS